MRAYRARGVMKDGRRFGRPADPHTPPPAPTGTINTTDHDSRIVRTQGEPPIQGYHAQAAVNEAQIIVAAELTVDSPDFGHLEPMVKASLSELENGGVTESPQTVVADPGYWHKQQMENVVIRGIQVVIPPDSGLRKGARPGWNKGLYAFMRRVLATEHGHAIYRRRLATVEPVFVQTKSTGGSIASYAAGERRAARNGASLPPPTTSSSSTMTASPPQGPEPAPNVVAGPDHRSPPALFPTATP